MYSKEYLHNIDLLKVGEIRNGRIHNISSLERTTLGASLSSENKGLLVFDTDLNQLFYWTGSLWNASVGGSSVNFVFNEVPNGLLDGINNIFTSLQNFEPGSVNVYLNGLKIKIVDEFNTVGNNTIILTVSPAATEIITIDYKKQ